MEEKGFLLDYRPELSQNYGKHRAGWLYALESLKELKVSHKAIRFDSFVDMTFFWGSKPTGGFYKEPWVGVIHNPYNVSRQSWTKSCSDALVKLPDFQKSLKTCLGEGSMLSPLPLRAPCLTPSGFFV